MPPRSRIWLLSRRLPRIHPLTRSFPIRAPPVCSAHKDLDRSHSDPDLFWRLSCRGANTTVRANCFTTICSLLPQFTLHGPDGTSLFTEKFVLDPRRFSVSRLGAMGLFHVFGNVILLTPKKHADRCSPQSNPRSTGRQARPQVSAARLYDAGLVFKVLGFEAVSVSAAIRAFWSLVRQNVVGARSRHLSGLERAMPDTPSA